jgi:putative transposase
MRKPYQIESQRALNRFEELVLEGNLAVQILLPMAEMVGWLHKGVGERSQPSADRTANRWGSERGYCVVMGQKVPVERPRVRSTDDWEVRLGSYEMFHRGEPLTETV